MIAFDAASDSGAQVGVLSYSWQHTCAGSDRYLVVGVSLLSGSAQVASITFRGHPLALLHSEDAPANNKRVELWGLVAPDAAMGNVEVTLHGIVNSSAGAISFTGVHQDSSTESAASNGTVNGGSAADATLDVTTLTGRVWVVDVLATTDTSVTVGAGQTERANVVVGLSGSGAMSTEGPQQPAGAVTMSWTDIGAGATWVMAGVALRPADGDGTICATFSAAGTVTASFSCASRVTAEFSATGTVTASFSCAPRVTATTSAAGTVTGTLGVEEC